MATKRHLGKYLTGSLVLASMYWLLFVVFRVYVSGELSRLDRAFSVDFSDSGDIIRFLIFLVLIFAGFYVQMVVDREKNALLVARKEREFLEDVLTVNDHGYWEMNMVSGDSYYSGWYHEFSGAGFKREKNFNGLIEKRIHTEDLDEVIPKIKRYIDAGCLYSEEYRVRNKKGNWCWLRDETLWYGRDDRGKIIKAIGFHKDITDLKTTEEELREAGRKHRDFVNNSKEPMLLTDEKGNVIEWNPAMAELTGITAGVAVSRKIWDIQHELLPDEKKDINTYRTAKEKYLEIFRTGRIEQKAKSCEVRIYCKGGPKDILQFLFCCQTRNGWRLGITARDMTEKKILADRLANSKEDFEQIVARLPVGVVFCNREGKIEYVNSRLLEILGSPGAEATEEINMRTFPLLEEKEISNLLDKAVEEGNPVTKELYYRSKWGKAAWLRCHFKPRYRKNRIIGVMIIVDDISESKEISGKLETSERNFRTFFETINDLIFVITPEGIIIDVNKTVPAKLGSSRENLVGTGIASLYTGSRDGGITEMIASPSGTAKVYSGRESYLRMHDGESLLPVEIGIWKGEWNDRECIFCAAKDITREKEVSQKFDKFFANNPSLMAVLTVPDGVFTDVNDAFVEKTGYSRGEVVGKTSDDLRLFPEHRKHKDIFSQFLSEGRLMQTELQVRTKTEAVLDGLFAGEVVETGGEKYFLLVMTDVTNQKKAEEKLRDQAIHDPLTGVYNRNVLQRLLVRRKDQPAAGADIRAVIAVDIDDYKEINDNYGHKAGDWVLKIFAKRLLTEINEKDILIRTGGDEFLICLSSLRERNDILDFVNRIKERCCAPYKINNEGAFVKLNISCSLGISLFPEDGRTFAELITSADLALYSVKEKGKGDFLFYNREIREREEKKFQTIQKISRALRENAVVPYYQPIIDRNGRVCKLEVLARIAVPGEEIVEAVDFIEIAENTGLVDQIGKVVLESSLKAARKWRKDGRDVGLAVNISARQLNTRYYHELKDIVLANPIPFKNLWFEITEMAFLENIHELTNFLEDLTMRGIRFSIDDFGTGYSSLSRLNSLPVRELKIDKEFIAGIADRHGGEFNRTLIRNVVKIAQAGNLDIVVEGVETAEELKTVRELGCHNVQGYYYSRPVPEEKVWELLNKQYEVMPGYQSIF